MGIVLIYDAEQTINIENWASYLAIAENNYKNSNSLEGGIHKFSIL